MDQENFSYKTYYKLCKVIGRFLRANNSLAQFIKISFVGMLEYIRIKTTTNNIQCRSVPGLKIKKFSSLLTYIIVLKNIIILIMKRKNTPRNINFSHTASYYPQVLNII